MAQRQTVFLMYHELEIPGRPLCQTEPGYVRYVPHASEFQSQMQLIKSQGWRGVCVKEALRYQPDTVAITFDDGSETDLICAAPILQELGFGATFYITTGFIGKPGYLNRSQLQELSQMGFEIGCHSMTHAYLTDLRAEEMTREVVEAKSQLEQLIGKPVEHFSCPGGRHNQRVSDVARHAGYRTVATSRLLANSPFSNPFALGRVSIMRSTSLSEFENLYRGRGLWQMDFLARSRRAMREVLGNTAYDRLRNALLRHESNQ